MASEVMPPHMSSPPRGSVSSQLVHGLTRRQVVLLQTSLQRWRQLQAAGLTGWAGLSGGLLSWLAIVGLVSWAGLTGWAGLGGLHSFETRTSQRHITGGIAARDLMGTGAGRAVPVALRQAPPHAVTF